MTCRDCISVGTWPYIGGVPGLTPATISYFFFFFDRLTQSAANSVEFLRSQKRKVSSIGACDRF